jgi:uncharacterized protein (TIGR03437 family)
MLVGPRSSSYLAIALLCAQARAQVVTTLINFDSTNGNPNSLVQGSDGNFYGTAAQINNLIFKLTPTGILSVIFRPPASGANASLIFNGALIQLSDGNFYGTASAGGAHGSGAVFKVTTAGAVTILYSLGTNVGDGTSPTSGLLAASDGNLYGTTYGGGANGRGTIFKCTPAGQYTTVYTFGTQATDGIYPVGRLIQATDGNIYGVTRSGPGSSQAGTVFRFTTTGVFATLHAFTGLDGFSPSGGLIQGSDGNFYGTTTNSVFKMTTAGAISTLHALDGSDGILPTVLLQASDGNLYGTSENSIYKVSPSGAFSVLKAGILGVLAQAFQIQQGSILQASDGDLYATAPQGNLNGSGSVFKIFLAPNPPPPQPTITTGGVVPVFSTVPTIESGEWVSIYGANLASTTMTWNGDFPLSLANTNVTINGKLAYLWYVSPTQINLQAPKDTATGTVPVVVTTPGGSAMSTVTLAQVAPSFSLLDPKHVAGIIVKSDGSGAFGGGTYDIVGPTGTSLGYQTVAAKAGDSVVLFAVGLGPTKTDVPPGAPFTGSAATTNIVNVLINNVSVTPAFSGETSAGLYQLNLTIPPGLGSGDVPLQAIVGGLQTPAGPVISLQ